MLQSSHVWSRAPPPTRPVVGGGGGVVRAAAKGVGWSLDLPFYLVPSSVSVDAMVTPTVAVRESIGVQYKGFAVADRIIVDMDLVHTAPIHLNRAGIDRKSTRLNS